MYPGARTASEWMIGKFLPRQQYQPHSVPLRFRKPILGVQIRSATESIAQRNNCVLYVAENGIFGQTSLLLQFHLAVTNGNGGAVLFDAGYRELMITSCVWPLPVPLNTETYNVGTHRDAVNVFAKCLPPEILNLKA